MKRKKKKHNIPVWNMSLRQIAVLRAVKDSPPTILERLKIKDYRKRICTDWGERVAIFTTYDKARAYLSWSILSIDNAPGERFRKDSLLSGYDRAWVTSMWVNVPIDPEPKKE